MRPVVELDGAGLRFGERTLWSGLDLRIGPGEFVTVLGPNGSGKSSLLKVLLGVVALSTGQAWVADRTARRGNRNVGYIPQQGSAQTDVPMRGRDLVGLGLDGHRWGLRQGSGRRAQIDRLLADVGATAYADVPLSELSGGEQQRLRVAQALATDPSVLLCDEPLSSLDPLHQRAVVDLLNRRRHDHHTAVVFVTHEINPVLALTDSVLYITNSAFRYGTVSQVMTSSVLSELYGSPVEVLRRGERMIVVGAEEMVPAHHHHHLAHSGRGTS